MTFPWIFDLYLDDPNILVEISGPDILALQEDLSKPPGWTIRKRFHRNRMFMANNSGTTCIT